MYVETLMVNSETLKTFGYQLTGTDAAGFRCSRVESRPSYCKSDRFLERGLALGFRVFDKRHTFGFRVAQQHSYKYVLKLYNILSNIL
jgi:hypothetical protein